MLSKINSSVFFALGLLASMTACPSAHSQEFKSSDEENTPKAISSFLEENCLGCHDSASKEGDLDLESLRLKLHDPDNFHHWEYTFDRVRSGEMPPDEDIESESKNLFLRTLRKRLAKFDSTRISSEGRVPARRLSRAQYERSVQGLLGIDVPLQDYLPEDSLSSGFDTVSKGQQISDHLMAAYLRTADAALDAAFLAAANSDDDEAVLLDWTQLRRDERRPNREPEGRPEQEDIVSWSTSQNFYGRMGATTVPESGRYQIRLLVQAVNPPKNGHVWCSLRSGACSAKESTLYWIDGFEATSTPTEHQFVARIRQGHKLQLRPNDSGLKKAPVNGGKGTISGPRGFIEELGVPGVAIKWIEMKRITPDVEKIRRALFGDLKVQVVAKPSRARAGDDQADVNRKLEIVSADPERDLKNRIRAFATRAFRRPVEDDELTPYFEFAANNFRNTESMAEAIRAAYRAILCSSRFLYFEEAPGTLDDHSLASRLSYFLWGTPPDDELRRLAAHGRLHDPNELRRQTDRLLSDPRSDTFVREFTDQWLQLYEIDFTTPDSQLYPEYDDVLHHTLRQESHQFVHDLIDNDLSVTNVVDSDFTYLNSRLARHYKIPWPGGTGLKRVKLDPADGRGGVITHASVLKVTANGTTTSPIIRGVWMLERITGQHVPPPPANVPAVEPDIRGATTIREQLDKHRNLESCAVCHVKIDPPGFALESYDVIGGFRQRYRAAASEGKKRWVDGLPVDPSYSLTTGESFDDIEGLKKILRSNPQQLARSFASQLVTYATGARPTFADRAKLEQIVGDTKRNDFGVRSLIHEVVQNPMFLEK